MERVWGYDFDVRTDAVDTFVSYLRRKLEAGGRGRIVHTVRGVGLRPARRRGLRGRGRGARRDEDSPPASRSSSDSWCPCWWLPPAGFW
ncbi:winged helix-turn-helix domain-containing protein [Streptomyces lydicus]|uniref:winged helix-turn-helix domain-containing protein n=1 Tax=Streptomyces lydicus TaxID=47763 RepID=UPI00240E32C7|nr:winged helix-turn-helix domain-containing protein [Streptomyces lydicus]